MRPGQAGIGIRSGHCNPGTNLATQARRGWGPRARGLAGCTCEPGLLLLSARGRAPTLSGPSVAAVRRPVASRSCWALRQGCTRGPRAEAQSVLARIRKETEAVRAIAFHRGSSRYPGNPRAGIERPPRPSPCSGFSPGLSVLPPFLEPSWAILAAGRCDRAGVWTWPGLLLCDLGRLHVSDPVRAMEGRCEGRRLISS